MKTRTELRLFLISSCLLMLLINSALVRSASYDSTAGQHDNNHPERRIPTPQLESPADIEQYVNVHNETADLGELLTMLGIASREAPGKCGSGIGTCSAQTIRVPSPDGDCEYEILRICYAGDQICWFLPFKREAGWKALSDVSEEWSRYEVVTHRLVSCGGKQWLVVNADTGGTGFLEYFERWLEIGNDGLSEVLLYPVSGHWVQGVPDDHKYNAKVSNETTGSGCEVVLRYEILRNPQYRSKLRWTTSYNRKLSFIWTSGAKRFELDKLKSDLDETSHNSSIGSVFRGIFSIDPEILK